MQKAVRIIADPCPPNEKPSARPRPRNIADIVETTRRKRELRKQREANLQPPPSEVYDARSGRTYRIGNLIGKGGFARVYEMTNASDGSVYAGKIIAKSMITRSSQKQKLQTEIRIHRGLKHHNIVRFIHCFQDQENYYLVLEYCPNKTITELVRQRKRLTEPEARFLLVQSIRALRHCHSSNVIHRDLKLSNLFLGHKLNVKLGDFGLAAKLGTKAERRRTLCGTPNYMAPEMIENNGGHSFEVDVWGMGVVLYTMLVGRPPFETRSAETTYLKIKAVEYRIPQRLNLSSDVQDLISKMLARVASDRITFDNVLRHPFIAGHSIPRGLPDSAWQPAPTTVTEHTGDEQINTLQTTASSRPPICPPRPASEHLIARRTTTTAERVTKRQTDQDAETGAGATRSSLQNQTSRPSHVVNEEAIRKVLGTISPEQDQAQYTLLQAGMETLTTRKRESSAHRAPSAARSSQQSVPGPFVLRWIDCSEKYGLGYQLTDGSVGVCYVDNTKSVCAQDQIDDFYLINRQSVSSRNNESNTIHSDLEPQLTVTSECTGEDRKKALLLRHFRKYLIEKSDTVPYRHTATRGATDLPYVKRWVRTSRAIAFRLSNKVIQLNFVDHSKVILSVRDKTVLFIDKSRNEHVLNLDTILAPTQSDESPTVTYWRHNTELVQRLRYTKKVIQLLIGPYDVPLSYRGTLTERPESQIANSNTQL